MTCKHHSRSREWSELSFEQRATLAQRHFHAGLRQVRCRCGEYVWGWEIVHPEPAPSGLRWSHVGKSWWLVDSCGGLLGRVRRATAFTWVAIIGTGNRRVLRGSLADCARELVGRLA